MIQFKNKKRIEKGGENKMKEQLNNLNLFIRKEEGQMKKITGILMVGLFIMGITGFVMAADQESHIVSISVPNICMLDINNTDNVAFVIIQPLGGAGEAPEINDDTDNSKQLWYTSIVPSGQERQVTVASDVDVPAGLTLNVAASEPTGGAGARGTGTNVDLSTSAQPIIDGIGTCYSSRINGAGITYTLSIDDPTNLVEADTDLTVTFTLTDAL